LSPPIEGKRFSIRLSLDAGSPRVFETEWGLEYGEIATSGISVRGRSSFSVAVPDKPKFGSTNDIEGNEPAAACAKNRKAAEGGEYPAIREGPKKLPQGLFRLQVSGTASHPAAVLEEVIADPYPVFFQMTA
jgi:hypothetical protein